MGVEGVFYGAPAPMAFFWAVSITILPMKSKKHITISYVAAMAMTIGAANAAVTLFEDDFSTNTLANYTTQNVTYNATPQTVTIARGTGNFLQINESFDLSNPLTTSVTIAFNFSFGVQMFGSDFDLQVNDGSGWVQLYNQARTATGENDTQQALNFRSDTFTSADFTFSSNTQFRIIDTNNGGSKGYTFDNLSVSVDAIPEPSAALLGGLGIIALLRRRR